MNSRRTTHQGKHGRWATGGRAFVLASMTMLLCGIDKCDNVHGFQSGPLGNVRFLMSLDRGSCSTGCQLAPVAPGQQVGFLFTQIPANSPDFVSSNENVCRIDWVSFDSETAPASGNLQLDALAVGRAQIQIWNGSELLDVIEIEVAEDGLR